ncbi:carbohydrate ABC transporter permease [Chelatococcus asaccharovorans]|uniref:Multiple sugar transport system permease protein n=1 Tax=Chelatococcus asaccharovorans TaxID=28210 RepID=A0A2V3U1B5_9HYPH|nr:sugar ABC transporter permease [Chelatococcus asaccharovorans]MBS7704501.1 sugar ABC transporter permease [Chelatococcus asaccharovorans]PXW55618.1 multiple sugar transport system permease protein [Chelatococcus asaccharovorans]CAH1663201.1 Multiple sugar transport system permease protein [Chelatococcus asaccharovorans]CAH1682924.1 Multiple sugar transport system permease protein [Chelatococcus asaccharovorans]
MSIAVSESSPAKAFRSWPNMHLWLFLGPCIASLIAVFLVPIWQTLQMSLYSDTMGRNVAFVGLANYARIIGQDGFLQLLVTSIIYTLGNVFFVWFFGLGIALLLNDHFPGRALIRAIFIIPWATPYVAASLIFSLLFNFDIGVLNYLLSLATGGRFVIDFLNACPNALISLTGISIWKLLPLGIVMMLSALQSIPDSHYEAAKVDGASRLQTFWYVTLPGVRSTTVMLTLLMMIWCFGRSFTAIYLLTGGGPAGCSETIVLRSYLEMFQMFHPGSAAALGVGVLLISMLCAGLYYGMVNRRGSHAE